MSGDPRYVNFWISVADGEGELLEERCVASCVGALERAGGRTLEPELWSNL